MADRCGLALLVILTWLTWQRVPVWHDDLTLWTDAVVKAPLKPRPWVNLGQAYAVRGQSREAVQAYHIARDLTMGAARTVRERRTTMSVTGLGLATLALQAGRCQDARMETENVMALRPLWAAGVTMREQVAAACP